MIIRKNSSKTFRPTSSQRGRDGGGGESVGASNQVNAKKKGQTASKSGANATNGSNQGAGGQAGHYRNKTQVVKKNIMM